MGAVLSGMYYHIAEHYGNIYLFGAEMYTVTQQTAFRCTVVGFDQVIQVLNDNPVTICICTYLLEVYKLISKCIYTLFSIAELRQWQRE